MRIHADPDPQPWLNISPYPNQAEGEWTLNNVCVLDNVYVCVWGWGWGRGCDELAFFRKYNRLCYF